MTKLKRDNIFRNSKNFYLEKNIYASHHLLKFASKYSGNRILDIGCATGEYVKKLNELGYNCIGVDTNPEYINIAKKKGLDCILMDAESLKFKDNTFETVILFELLEHTNNPVAILKEAKRVATKNILITVPNCTKFSELRSLGLTYDHFLDLDHVNFFKKSDLEDLLSKNFKKFKVYEKEPIAISLSGLPWWLRFPISSLNRLKIIDTNIYYRLYAVAEAI